MAERDWFEWHRAYEHPDSALSARLEAIQRGIVGTLDGGPAGVIRTISICAGQGRDLLEVLRRHPRRNDVAARLVELDPRNAAVAKASAGDLSGVEVVVGDASTTTAYEGAVPADLVLACGVFGHAVDDDIRSMVCLLPTLCAPGATVVWTRGGRPPDLRPRIRRWFIDAGFEEISYESAGTRWGVGVHRLVVDPRPFEAGIRLFSFVDELHREERASDYSANACSYWRG